jgi:hypothetical protein
MKTITPLRQLDQSPTDTSVSRGRNNVDALDATIVDVYKDTQAVIFMVNPTAQSSLEYVR